MKKCPICGEEIDYLAYYSGKQDRMACVYYNEKFDKCSYNYSGWGIISRSGGTESCYSCPKCGELLFNKKIEAKEFLKSGELPEHRIPYFVERKLSR